MSSSSISSMLNASNYDEQWWRQQQQKMKSSSSTSTSSYYLLPIVHHPHPAFASQSTAVSTSAHLIPCQECSMILPLVVCIPHPSTWGLRRMRFIKYQVSHPSPSCRSTFTIHVHNLLLSNIMSRMPKGWEQEQCWGLCNSRAEWMTIYYDINDAEGIIWEGDKGSKWISHANG